MPRHIKRFVLGAVAGTFVFGVVICMGIPDADWGEALAQQCPNIQSIMATAAPSNNKAVVEDLISNCDSDARSGKLGLMELSNILAEIELMTQDQSIDKAEMLAFESTYKKSIQTDQ